MATVEMTHPKFDSNANPKADDVPKWEAEGWVVVKKPKPKKKSVED